MHTRLLALAAVVSAVVPGLAAASPVQHERQIGRETSIPFASSAAIRDWASGPAGSNVIYLKDRTQHWYRVTLSGPCLRGAQTLIYHTQTGMIDRFTTIGTPDRPYQRCGIDSIKTSLAPPSRQSRKRR